MGFCRTFFLSVVKEPEADGVVCRFCREKKDLPQLSSLGHFLKGSSAALGITKVKDSCEKMQHYGNMRDEETEETLTEQEALDKIKALITVVQEEYDEARAWLERYYKEKESGGE